MEQCRYNARCIVNQLKKGSFQSQGFVVEKDHFRACILVQDDTAFTNIVSETVRSVVEQAFEKRNVMAISAECLDDALLSIDGYGLEDGQWIISSLQGALPNKDIPMIHVHAAPHYGDTRVTRVLVVYPETYSDICIVFVPMEEKRQKRRKKEGPK